MKKFLPIVAFVSVVIASLLYILPSFNVTLGDTLYVFTNLPSFTKKNVTGLELDVAGFTPSYVYEVESVSQLNKKDWTYAVAKDQIVLERRLESFIGRSFEVRADEKEGRVVYSVYTQQPLGLSKTILTTNNADFKISADESTLTGLTAETETETELTSNFQEFNVSRSDFGDASIAITQGADSNLIYEVRLPIITLSPEKINLIKTKAGYPISVFIGGRDFTGSFSINLNGAPTDLVLRSASSIDEAAELRTYLNTEPYHLGYTLNSVNAHYTKYHLAKFAGILVLFFFAALFLTRYAGVEVSGKKILIIISTTILGLALMKVYGVAVTTGVIILFAAHVIMSLLSVRYIYYGGFAVILILIQLLGYLYFIQINWTQLFIVIITSLLSLGTNYYVSKNQK